MAVAKADHQTAKFNSPPNFPAIRYVMGYMHAYITSRYRYMYMYMYEYNVHVAVSSSTVQ